eukprot:5060582-Amphidinium_carterae.1
MGFVPNVDVATDRRPNLSFPAPSDDDGSTGTSLLHGDSQARPRAEPMSQCQSDNKRALTDRF